MPIRTTIGEMFQCTMLLAIAAGVPVNPRKCT